MILHNCKEYCKFSHIYFVPCRRFHRRLLSISATSAHRTSSQSYAIRMVAHAHGHHYSMSAHIRDHDADDVRVCFSAVSLVRQYMRNLNGPQALFISWIEKFIVKCSGAAWYRNFVSRLPVGDGGGGDGGGGNVRIIYAKWIFAIGVECVAILTACAYPYTHIAVRLIRWRPHLLHRDNFLRNSGAAYTAKRWCQKQSMHVRDESYCNFMCYRCKHNIA